MSAIVANKDLTYVEKRDRLIRMASYDAHQEGLSTPFAYSAMHVYAAGGAIGAKDENALKKAGLLNAKTELTEKGVLLLVAGQERGDRPFIWAEDIARKAGNAPRLVPQAA